MKKLFIILLIFTTSVIYAQPDLSGLSFCIDPGHGGSDQGATGPTGWKERVTNDRVSFFLEDFLNTFNADTVILTRRSNIYLSLNQREQIANSAGVSMFHSVHHNAVSNSSVDYTLVLYEELTSGTPQWPGISDVLSDSMSARLSRFQKIQDIGGRGDISFLGFNLGVLNNLSMPGQLSEGNFVSNPLGEAREKNMEWCKTEAQALAYAILDFYNEPIPETATLVGTLRHIQNNKPLTNALCRLIEPRQSYLSDYFGNGFFRFEGLDDGDYTLRVLTIFDTLESTLTVANGTIRSFVLKLEGETTVAGVPPDQPVLKSVTKIHTDSIRVEWYPSSDTSIDGYRLYSSTDGDNWNIHPGTDIIDTQINSYSYYSQQASYFKLVTIRFDALGDTLESEFSDSYGIQIKNNQTPVLIVDGYDRQGSWGDPQHNFVIYNSEPIIANNGPGFASTSNDAVIDGSLNLYDYQSVIWILGDESTADRTFNNTEKTLVKTFLENGGNLFVTGSEIGWELGRSGGPNADLNFYQNYLKAQYLEDDAGNLNAAGIAGTIFDDVTVRYGVTYPEDYPDVIQPANGSVQCMKYGNDKGAAIQYEGVFGSSTVPGKLVYIAFPFETIGAESKRNLVMEKVLVFFDHITTVDEKITKVPDRLVLLGNYPNPFNAETVIEFLLPHQSLVKIELFNIRGQLVATVIHKKMTPGHKRVKWNAGKTGSGTYFYRITTKDNLVTGKCVLLK